MSRKQLRSFIGMIKYCRKMWQGCSEVLVPLAALVSKATPWKLMLVEQKAFDQAKKTVSQEMLLVYPDFNLLFEIYMDVSDTPLGSVIS
eukprot:6556999-Ditylum_brightwellii.AAC.1